MWKQRKSDVFKFFWTIVSKGPKIVTWTSIEINCKIKKINSKKNSTHILSKVSWKQIFKAVQNEHQMLLILSHPRKLLLDIFQKSERKSCF